MITYIVKARLGRNIGTDDFTFETFEKEFRNEDSPIEARKQAFQYYYSVIGVIGDEKDDYGSIEKNIDLAKKQLAKNPLLRDKEDDIHSYLSSNNYVDGGELGVVVYYRMDRQLGYNVIEEDVDFSHEEFMIAGKKSYIDYMFVIHSLEYEYMAYRIRNWDTDNQIQKYHYWEDPHWEWQKFLRTPFDFKANAPKHAFQSSENIKEQTNETLVNQEKKAPTSIFDDIIKGGENRNTEFKSSLRFCHRQKAPMDYVEYAITKTIVAFANTEGGVLLIGVDDEGNVLGIDKDIDSFKSKSKDGFLKHFDNLIKTHFSEPIDAIIKFGFEQVQSKTFFMVNVEKSNKARFLIVKSKGKEFYIRRSASSHSLDIEEATQYIIDKWYANANEGKK